MYIVSEYCDSQEYNHNSYKIAMFVCDSFDSADKILKAWFPDEFVKNSKGHQLIRINDGEEGNIFLTKYVWSNQQKWFEDDPENAYEPIPV